MSEPPTSQSLLDVFKVIEKVYGSNPNKVSKTVTGHKDSGLPQSHQR